MRVSQADTINLLYLKYNDTISNLKLKNKYYDSVIQKIYNKQDSILYWKRKNEELERSIQKRRKIIEEIDYFSFTFPTLILTIIILIKAR